MGGSNLIKSIAGIIGSDNPLPGAPGRANIPGQGETIIGQNPAIMRSAEEYAERSGIPLRNPTQYQRIDRPFAEMAADYYDRMPHNPNDYRTKQAYDALGKETEAQFEQMLRDGVTPYLFSDKDPYPNSPYQALQDIYDNQRLGVYSTRAGFGSDDSFDPTGNPLLQEMDYQIDGKPIFLNDAFRAVHDYYGHGKHGFGFRAGGEENAFQAHSGMFSDLARQAAASETRGQNSLLNYGPKGDTNRTAKLEDTVFADQKTGLLPNLISTGRTPISDERRRRIDADGVSGLRGKLEGAINPDGIVEAVHYGNRQFDYLDPSQYGKGMSGRTTTERNMAATPEFYDRTFAGLNTTERPYRKEQGLGPVENTVQLPVEQVYDILADPDNIKGAVGNGLDPYSRYTALTKKIYDAGYSAIFQDHPQMGKILSIVDPLKTGKILAAVPVAMLGTKTAKAAIGAGLTGAALAPEESQAGVRKVGETLFDLSRLDEVPDVPQVPLERIDPARGLSPKIEPLLTPEAAARMEGYANVGRDKGGLGWYNLDPLRQSFMEELGEEQGTANFNAFVDKIAATSPRAKVANNIRRASYLDILDRQGQPFAGLTNDDLPPGYGHIAHKTHDASLRDLQNTGSFAALNRPKTSSFAENLKGNQAPMTIDTHNFAALKGDPKDKKSPADTQYKYLEEFQGQIAEKMGMTPAQFQASVWMGGETGVADDRPFMAVFDDVVANTAERDGVTKKKALQNFIQGKGVLYDLGPIMLAGGLGANLLANDFSEQASAVGEVAAAGLTSLAAPFLTGPSSFLESMNPAIPVDELERRRAARQDRVTSEIRSPLAQAYAEQARQAVAPVLQDINQNPYLNALPFDELYEYGSNAVKDLPARLRFMGSALLDSTGL